MVSFRAVKVWVTYIVFLSNGILRVQSRGQFGFESGQFVLLLNIEC